MFSQNTQRILASAGILFFISLFSFSHLAIAADDTVFKLHLSNEPSQLDPHQQKSSASSYLLSNLYRNIFTYDDKKGLLPDLGESCKRETPMVLVCKLKKDLQWSDGSPLTAEDFLKAYKRILDPQQLAPRADLLFKIKNAPAIFKGQKKLDTLGITTPDKYTLRFELEEKDPDFEYNLASFLIAPIKNTLKPDQKAQELIVSGPYKISDWKAGQKIVLVPNTNYKSGNPKRPNVEFYFIPEDSVALQLYEKNELSLLRRLPTLYIEKYKTRPDFVWVPVLRFDYVGFGPALADLPKTREALSLSLNFPELQKIFSAETPPGCAGIPDAWTTEVLCYKQDPSAAKKAFAEESSKNKDLKFQLYYSSLGGEDHRRATEWMQAQWQKHLGIKVGLVLKENKIYLKELKEKTPILFRKGVAPDRPTCLATLETFADWSPENYIQVKDPKYTEILKKLENAVAQNEQKKLCTEGIQFLMKNYLLIPTGKIHFAMLAKVSFKNWRINAMNQLDLANLTVAP